jgi:hypothetical protein
MSAKCVPCEQLCSDSLKLVVCFLGKMPGC